MATGFFGKLCMTTDVLWHTLYGKRGIWQALYANICLVAHSIWQQGSLASSVWQQMSCGTLNMATGVFGKLCMNTCGTLYMATGVFGKLCMATYVLWHTLYGNRGLWQALYDNICLVAHSIWQEGSLASSV